MRNSKKSPLVTVKTKAGKCCDGILRVGADQLPLMQKTIFGTSAWWEFWGRRNVVESVNADLKGKFTSIDRGYIRTKNSRGLPLMFAYTLAGLNRWVHRSWLRTQKRLLDSVEAAKKKRAPRKGRHKTFEDIGLAPLQSAAEPDPPPTD
jgi:hypothetical protein